MIADEPVDPQTAAAAAAPGVLPAARITVDDLPGGAPTDPVARTVAESLVGALNADADRAEHWEAIRVWLAAEKHHPEGRPT